MYFDLDRNDPNLNIKQSLLEGEGASRGIRISMTYDDPSTREAFSYMRFICAQGNEIMILPRVDRDFNWDDDPISPLSKETEIKVLMFLRDLCLEQLAKYPTTLEYDNMELESEELEMYSNERNAKVLVRGEKEVAHFWINLADVAIPLLESGEWKDIKRTINKDYKKQDAMSRYIGKVIPFLVKGGSTRK